MPSATEAVMSRHLAVTISRAPQIAGPHPPPRIVDGVLRIPVAEVVLDKPEVVALIRQVEAA